MSIIQGTSKSSAAAAHTIDQSIRFNDNDTAYLDNTTYSGSPTSGTDCTFSFWVKRCNLSTTQCLFFGGNPSGSTWEVIRFESDNQFRVGQASSAYNLTTSQVFRDVGAWSHFVVAFDTDNATAADRIKIYHNGSRITDFSLETNPSSGYVTNFNTGGAGEFIRIGYQGGGSNPIDVYLAEINFVDGQALDPTSFGETNADGVWVPIAYTGSYGTNGFYITGADSADLGADDSGNGNDFTSSGLAAADQMLDTPTNNFWTLNPTDPYSSNITISDGNLRAVMGAAATGSVFAPMLPETGKWAWEITATLNMGSGTEYPVLGIVPANNADLSGPMRAGGTGEGYGADGRFFSASNGTNSAYGATWADGDIIEVGWDADNGTLSFWHNGSAQGTAVTGLTGRWKPAQDHYSTAGGDTLSDFGQSGYTPTDSSYKTLCTANLPDPTIADPSAYFQTSLWNGNGSTQTITQDGNSTFQPGWIWSKGRNNVQEHVVFDEVRGTTKYLKVSPAGTEATQSGVTAFNSDGFDLGSWAVTNGSSQTHVGWQWKAGGTSGSSNTDGSITSTVSADTTSGFSIATYTGNATVGATVGHGLGVAPKMVIVKSRSNSESWVVGHDSMGWTKAAYLNSTSTPFTLDIYWNNTAPTSSVVELHDHPVTNGSGYTYVMYSFAEVEGFSKFTSYEGNASTDGPFINCGFRPSFVLIKNIDAAEDWWIQDAAREPFNGGNMARLAPNSSAAEADNVAWFDFVSNGLKVRYNAGGINSSGTHIVMAFAESPFRYANAR